MWDWETDIGKGQDRQRQLLSFDAGSIGTGDSKAKGGKDSESCSCSRTSPYRVWKGKTEIQGVSVSEGTADPFFYEGERYEIQIEDVKLFPQGYSALALYPEYLKDEPSVLLVDIGGWTVDLMRLDNAVPNAATCRSLELGVIRCMDEIREQVRRNTGLSVTETQIERVLHGKPSSMPAEVVSLIERQGRLYIEKILSAITEAGFDLRAVPSVFMGGGAAIFKHRVSEQDRLCRPIYLTDVHANAAGYERIVGQMRTL